MRKPLPSLVRKPVLIGATAAAGAPGRAQCRGPTPPPRSCPPEARGKSRAPNRYPASPSSWVSRPQSHFLARVGIFADPLPVPHLQVLEFLLDLVGRDTAVAHFANVLLPLRRRLDVPLGLVLSEPWIGFDKLGFHLLQGRRLQFFHDMRGGIQVRPLLGGLAVLFRDRTVICRQRVVHAATSCGPIVLNADSRISSSRRNPITSPSKRSISFSSRGTRWTHRRRCSGKRGSKLT